MGLLDDLKCPVVRNYPCRYAEMYSTLELDEQEALDEALSLVLTEGKGGKGKRYTMTWLSGVLTNNGHPISRSTITRHLNKECVCE